MKNNLAVHAILIILVLVIVVFLKDDPISPEEYCEETKLQLSEQVINANYCEVDSDCVLTDQVDCPFGCSILINKNVDMGPIKASIDDYRAACGNCEHDCQLFSEPYVCRNNICFDQTDPQIEYCFGDGPRSLCRY